VCKNGGADSVGDGNGEDVRAARSDAEDLSVAGTHASISTKSSSRNANAAKMSSWQNLRYYTLACDGFAAWHDGASQGRKDILDNLVRESVTGKKKKEKIKPVLLVLRTDGKNSTAKDSALDYMRCGKGPFG
jgi:hypothetical protein